ncbi:hypothetical protein SteCoe_31072 [Stentor coeruleus]|uniref:Uncharacterized protein n=1 Tax=Stentor coeruleus TaxID=5963 RepID=A0A1R2B283_9CILI|nr:hypothetical protein SteCoe_31072 [Stentor coeruleus]
MRSEQSVAMFKITYYRKQSVEKLYRLLKRKVLIDMRIVKRFRIWQILILKHKIAIFLRKVKETNRKFLLRSFRVVVGVLEKPLRISFNKLSNCEYKAQVPKTLNPKVSVCKLALINIKIQSRSLCTSLLPSTIHDSDLKSKSFALWKSRAYKASPFLHRNLVLTLSVMAIVLKLRWQNLTYGFQKVNRMKQRVETISLCKTLEKITIKRISQGFRKISQPRFIRKKAENIKVDEKIMKQKIKTSTCLLEMLVQKKRGIEIKQMELALSNAFHKMKQVSNENNVPNFIMKRHYRSWSLKLMINALTYQHMIRKKLGFGKLRLLRPNLREDVFPIDKSIIENQAQVLVRLESQQYAKLKEFKVIKRCEKVNKCRKVFWKCLRMWLARWCEILNAPDNLEKLFEYLRFLESQAENGQEGVELTDVRAIIERRSTEVTGKLIDSDSSINFRSL